MNTTLNQKIKYFLYARKSEESEDRQALSIPSQIEVCKNLAKEHNLKIVNILYESQTAKKPGRKKFNEMIERINNGEANGIICWKLNRLARNPIDGGNIQWLIQNGVIRHIMTPERDYKTGDNVLIMSVEFGMANQFIIDLSNDTKRGLDNKLKEGWLPNIAPIGYSNNVLKHTIVKDSERFGLVRQMWNLMLTGSYTPSQILEKASNEWGLRTRKHKRIGGKELSLSGIYRVFSNVFYAGIISRKDGREFQGKHEQMITIEEFERVQELLGRKGKPRPKKHQFAFTGVIRCSECGCLYTAERKHKLIHKTGQMKEYAYYHCTKKKKNIKCNSKALKERDIELQIEEEIEKLTILPEFLDWALKDIRARNDTEIDDRSKIYEMQHKTLVKTQQELDELTKMRYRKLIDDDAFLKEKKILEKTICKMESNLRKTERRAKEWQELAEKTFHLATYAHKEFIFGDLQKKKEILLSLGQNFIIKDKKLLIEANEWLQPIEKGYPVLEKEYTKVRTNKNLSTEAKTEALTSVITQWGG